jgi:two-component system, OmpR family, KDP operon response regulator KdpE
MTQPGPRILIVDDEPQIRRFLRPALEHAGYIMLEAATGQDALVQASTRAPELILLDLGLPDMDGLEVLRRLREWTPCPIIVVSARGEEAVKVQALDLGADDYLTKPFGVDELLARLRVAIRHSLEREQAGAASEFTTGDLRVDLVKRQVWVHNQEVHLTPLEYKLLLTLIKHAGKVLTHQFLLRTVWGEAYLAETHYLRIYMRQLRHKLEHDPARPRYLTTESGVGYRLRELDDVADR